MHFNMEFIKKHWKKIVLGLFVIIFFGMCSNNCSNKNELRNLKSTYSQADSIMTSMNDSILFLNDSIKYLNKDIESLKRDNFALQNHVSDLNKALNRNVVVNIKQDTDE